MNSNHLFRSCVVNIPTNLNDKLDMSLRISDNIEEYLKQRGMSQKDLAEKMNKRPSEISKWMRGTHNFTIYTLYDIAKVLDVRVIDLIK
jgi:transcriptional regulator with XRE-family HTH domain